MRPREPRSVDFAGGVHPLLTAYRTVIVVLELEAPGRVVGTDLHGLAAWVPRFDGWFRGAAGIVFNNFTDKVASNRKNIDVNWKVLISMKINKVLVASISTELIYDHNIPVPLYYKDAAGLRVQDGTGQRTQFKEILAVGLSYKF